MDQLQNTHVIRIVETIDFSDVRLTIALWVFKYGHYLHVAR